MRKFIGSALPGDLEELHTEVACMTDGMLQNMLSEYLVHSIVKRAAEPVRKFIGEALPGDLEELHTEVACRTDGMLQNML